MPSCRKGDPRTIAQRAKLDRVMKERPSVGMPRGVRRKKRMTLWARIVSWWRM